MAFTLSDNSLARYQRSISQMKGVAKHAALSFFDGGGGTSRELTPATARPSASPPTGHGLFHIARLMQSPMVHHHFLYWPDMGMTVEYYKGHSGFVVNVRSWSEAMAQGRFQTYWICGHIVARDAGEALCRAMLNLGRKKYSIDYENCEHLVTFCNDGKPECAQAAAGGVLFLLLKITGLRQIVRLVAPSVFHWRPTYQDFFQPATTNDGVRLVDDCAAWVGSIYDAPSWVPNELKRTRSPVTALAQSMQPPVVAETQPVSAVAETQPAETVVETRAQPAAETRPSKLASAPPAPPGADCTALPAVTWMAGAAIALGVLHAICECARV
jgi:hypothetical protein